MENLLYVKSRPTTPSIIFIVYQTHSLTRNGRTGEKETDKMEVMLDEKIRVTEDTNMKVETEKKERKEE